MAEQRASQMLVALVALVMAAVVAHPVRAGLFNPETATLANGLEVVVIPDHRAPVVTHMVWYRVGAADDPSGKSGLAHFLEHLMFKGTPSAPAVAAPRTPSPVLTTQPISRPSRSNSSMR